MRKQPAFKSYVFGEGYESLLEVFLNSWEKTFVPVKNEAKRLGDKFSKGQILGGLFLIPIDLVVFGAITVFNIAVNLVISLFLLLVLLAVGTVVGVAFFLLRFSDWVYRMFRKIKSHCPSCQKDFSLPIYRCSCGRDHTKLVPGVYGLFKRTCLCGKKLPTTFFNGRQKLEAHCQNPDCGYVVEDGGEHIESSVVVVGGPSSGKTCYVNMAISQLEAGVAKKNNLEFEYAFNSLNDYQSIIEGMRRRRLPDKTTEMRLQYYKFYLTPPGQRLKRLFSLCDVSGELFGDGTVIGEQIGFGNADAFLVIIDPLSVRQYKEEVEKRFRITGYNPSVMSIDEIMSRVITTLEDMHAAKTNSTVKMDIAVVFTKCDIPGLDEVIGKKAVSRCMHYKNVSEKEAANIVCEGFLHRYGEDNFINTVRSRFKSIQYFTCSSLGYSSNDPGFVPDAVEEPILWIYKQIFG